MAIRILLASAEFDPYVKIGGLGEATAGLARALGRLGARVDVVIPDYPVALSSRHEWGINIPEWAGGRARVRSAVLTGVGEVHAVSLPGIERPHPYVDPATNRGWSDNDHRFYAFGTAVAALAERLQVDILHLNDWHTAGAVAWFPPERTVLTIHNLSHQGTGDIGWLAGLGPRASAFEHLGQCNPLAAAIRLCERVVTVSPGYAREILTPEFGAGLEGELLRRGDRFTGIRNGIDAQLWNPAEDPHLPVNFSRADLAGKAICTKELRRIVGLDEEPTPVIGMVSRFVGQKGIDLVLELLPFLATIPAQLVLHGTGDSSIVDAAERGAHAFPGNMRVVPGYDEAFAHLVVGGSDLLCVPSRFEPCGLTQMQAMTCGTIPVVTQVGGLADTVVDADREPEQATGFVASEATVPALLDALHRAGRGWRNQWRRRAIQQRGMDIDWTWQDPGRQYLELFRDVVAGA